MKSQVFFANNQSTDGRLTPILRHYYHFALTWVFAAAAGALPDRWEPSRYTSGPYSGKIARICYQYGSGDQNGNFNDAGYTDTVQALTSNSAAFTSARKRGAFSSEYASLILTIGLMPVQLPRRFATASTADYNGARIVPFAGGVEYTEDAAINDQLFGVFHSAELQLLPNNSNEQCSMFFGTWLEMAPGTGQINSGLTSLGTADRRGSFQLGADVVIPPNPNSSDFQPNQILLLIGSPITAVSFAPGAPAAVAGDVLAQDFVMFVDVAYVNYVDANGIVLDPINPQAPVANIQPIDDANRDRIVALRGQCV